MGHGNDCSPRRISVWNAANGKFVKELFGPTDYGAGGGAINPADPHSMFGQGTTVPSALGRTSSAGWLD